MRPDKSIIIFGRSPFIDKVDVHGLIERFDTIGFNFFGQHYPVDYLFFFDRYFDGFLPGCEVFFPHWFNPKHKGNRFSPKLSDLPVLTGDIKEHNDQPSTPVYGYKYYTPSIALNWAILQGYQKAYLVGIDNVETDTIFKHHDGNDLPANLTPKSHQGFKQYVYNCTPYIKIYQTNPAVKKQWDLPFIGLEALYAKGKKEK